MSEPGKDLISPFRDVSDPDELSELVERSQGLDLRPKDEPITPVNPVGSIHEGSGARVVASFPGVGPMSLARMVPGDARAVTRNIAEAIRHQFTVAQMIVWVTQPTKGRKRGRYTVHYVETCPALRRAKHAKVQVLQRQPTGLPFPEERGCKKCAALEAEIEREAAQARVVAMLEQPTPDEWYEVQTDRHGDPRWIVVSPEGMTPGMTIPRAQVCVKAAFDLAVLPHPESISREWSSYVDRIHVIDRRAIADDYLLASSVDNNPQTEGNDGT